MFIFVLSSGISSKSDVIQILTDWLGAPRRGSTLVAKVYGKKVTDIELDNLKKQRELANTIVLTLTYIARETAYGELAQERQKEKGLEEFDQNQRIMLTGRIRQPQERDQWYQFGDRFGASARG